MDAKSELGILRQLLHREQAFFDVEKQQAKRSQNNLFDSIKNVVFQTRKVYSLHLSIIEQIKTGDPTIFQDLTNASNTTPPPSFTTSIQRSYQQAISTLLQNSDGIPAALEAILNQNPSMEDYLTFSLLPALFSCFWSIEETSRLLDIIIKLPLKYQISLTRTLLVHPTFFVFLSSIQTEAEHLLPSSESTPKSLLDLLGSHLILFPMSLRTLLSKVQNKTQFFIDAILTPIFTFPSMYGFLPPGETRTFKSVLSHLNQDDITSLVTKISSIEKDIQMQPSEVPLLSVIASNEQFIYLFKEDCDLISTISPTEKVPFGTYPILYRKVTGNVKGNSPGSSVDSNSVEEDPFESLLRSLVIRLDVSHPEGNIIDTLNSALLLHAGSSRLQFELSLDEFKQMKTQRNAPDDVAYYVNLLKTAYESRMKHRKAALSNSTASNVLKSQITQSTLTIEFLEQKRLALFISAWAKTGVLDPFTKKIGDFVNGGDEFPKMYSDLYKEFVAYAESKTVTFSRDLMMHMFYDCLMKNLSFPHFVSNRKDLCEIDSQIHDLITNHLDFLYENLKEPFLQEFKDKSELLQLATDYLKRAFKEDTLLEIGDLIEKAITVIVQVLSFKGFKDIGADQQLPLTILLFINLNPEHVESLAEYNRQFMLSLSDEYIPCRPSIHYYLTMMETVSQRLKQELKRFQEKKS